MISSDIEKKRPNITAEDVKEVGGKIEDKAAEGRKGTELQSGQQLSEGGSSNNNDNNNKQGTKNMKGAGPGGAGMA